MRENGAKKQKYEVNNCDFLRTKGGACYIVRVLYNYLFWCFGRDQTLDYRTWYVYMVGHERGDRVKVKTLRG